MDRIKYTGNSLLTGTAIAEGLLAYAQALTSSGQSATVTIPSLQSDGSTQRAIFLIGPSSQLISESEDSDFDELVDEALVAKLTRGTQLLTKRNGPAIDEATYPATAIGDLDLPEVEADPTLGRC
jgi:hypothetical protein